MSTPLSGSGRHRRRIRLGLPVAAAGVVAAVAAALLTSPASAATTVPTPTVKPVGRSVPAAELEKRVAGALAGDDIAGATTSRSSLSASTSSSATSGTSTSTSTVDPKIIGGTETTITSAPWMVQLWYIDDQDTTDKSDDVGFFCGGAMVAPTKILTAAHCVKGYDWYNNGFVISGTSQLLSTDSYGNADLHGGTVSWPLRQWSHPSYNAAAIDNDIAVLTLDTPAKGTPIRMTTSGDTASYAAGTSAKVYGWGRTSSTSQNISPTLKVATLPMQSDTTCSGYYGSDFVKGHMVCAGKPATGSDTGTTSACNGDSGGPLVVNNRIVGVVSWGVTDCVANGAYSVFSKVSTYVGAAYARVDDANLSYTDSRADLWVRDSSTKTGYEKDSKGTSFGARESWGNWSGVNVVLQTDLDRDGIQDLVYRVSATGDLYWTHYVRSAKAWATKQIATGWKTRTRIVTPGDVTGDYLPDVLSVDSSGYLWIYPGKGNGTFGSRVKVGSSAGWNQYDALVGHGDLTGDGKADLIARNRNDSSVYLYKGTGTSFSSRIKVRTWSGYNKLVAVGDVTGDGKADLLTRTSGGTLYLNPGTGKATSEIFATRISVGTGYQQYDIWG